RSEKTSLGNLGNAYDSLGEYERAIDFQQQSLEIAREIGDLEEEMRCLAMLGSTYHSSNQHPKAIESYEQSLAISQQIGNREHESGALCDFGNVYQSLEEYEKAIELYQLALLLQKEIGVQKFEANTLNNLGTTYNAMGQHQQAILYYQQALEILKKLGNHSKMAASLRRLAETYHHSRQCQLAISTYQEYLDIVQGVGDRPNEATTHWSLNNLHQQRGHFRKAQHHRHQAYRTWQEINLPLAAAPLPDLQKRMLKSMGDDWAEQMIASEQTLGWLMIPLGTLAFTIRQLLSPLTFIPKRLKIKPLWFWLFTLSLGLILLIAWLRR
ncbi:MAG: tetratricopeptide repeat protein, partial [Synechococcales cyanobacterium CRU_2_2]|nr:tetratricopeptide repeat protein [Synechococcales cyanobacterium CRU_2_2]